MAELQEGGDVHSGRGKKRGGVRAKKISTRIDMTPMVDLGFLLVTFFILTTTMQRPKAMQVVMPEKLEDTTNIDKTKIRASEALTLILGNNDRIFYYSGKEGEETEADGGIKMEVTNFRDVRKFLIDKYKEVLAKQIQNGWKQNGVYVLIKPTKDSKYENLVNILDEMKITQVKSFAIVDVTPEELAMLPQ